MTRYQLPDGNIVIADADFIAAHHPGAVVAPDLVPDPPAPELHLPSPVWTWYIDIGPFFDRFGAAKMAVLTSSDVGVKAILADTQVRKWIDLKRPEVTQSIAYIASVVPSLTAELQDSILNTAVSSEENLALRRVFFS